jgi:hypothetical protein
MYFGGRMSGSSRIGDAGQLRDWMMLRDRNAFWELSAKGYLALLNFSTIAPVLLCCYAAQRVGP